MGIQACQTENDPENDNKSGGAYIELGLQRLENKNIIGLLNTQFTHDRRRLVHNTTNQQVKSNAFNVWVRL